GEGDTDLLTNYYAAQVSNGHGAEALRAYPLSAEDVGESFDLLFNVACAYISMGRISQAESTLQEALDLCRHVLGEDGLTEEEVLKSYKKSDELLAVAANNLAVLRGDKDLPDSLRRLRSTISSASEERLTRSQLMDLRYNRCILLLHLKKVEECNRYGVTARSVIIRASIVAAGGDYENCDQLLQKEITRLREGPDCRSDSTARAIENLSVVRAQSCIHHGLYAQAEQILSSLEGVRNTVAGISAMYQLKLAMCRQQQAEGGASSKEQLEAQLLEYLIDAARRLANADSECTDDALRVDALFHIARELQSSQNHKEASRVLEILLGCADAIDSTQRLTATSLLTAALSRCDTEEAARVASVLPQVDCSDKDAAGLERAEIPRLFKRTRPSAATPATDVLAEAEAENSSPEQREAHSAAVRRARAERKRAKRREAYLQKLQEDGKYDPARPSKPDPERWLPLKHRSYNKRGRKNRHKFVGGQGSGDGAQKDMQKLDVYARTQAAAENPAKKSGVVVESSSGPSKKKGRSKKK
ncbi:SRP72, partial [Symbiodinium microadriaticum]